MLESSQACIVTSSWVVTALKGIPIAVNMWCFLSADLNYDNLISNKEVKLNSPVQTKKEIWQGHTARA